MKEQNLLRENWGLISVASFLFLACIGALIYQTVYGEFSKVSYKEPESNLLPVFFYEDRPEKG